jgi:hypothetical protein
LFLGSDFRQKRTCLHAKRRYVDGIDIRKKANPMNMNLAGGSASEGGRESSI